MPDLDRVALYIGGRPIIWRGHQCERLVNGRHRTLCGLDVPKDGGYLSCDQGAVTCMSCALALDAEMLE